MQIRYFASSYVTFLPDLQQQRKHNLCHIRKGLFNCDRCDYSVKLASSLEFHRINNHNSSPAKNGAGKIHRFACFKCDFTAHRKDLLQGHLQRHGSNAKYTCIHCDYSCHHNSFVLHHQSKFHQRKLFPTNLIFFPITSKRTISVKFGLIYLDFESYFVWCC